MFFNLTCLGLLEEKGVQLLVAEKVSAASCEILKGPRLQAVALSLHPSHFPQKL